MATEDGEGVPRLLRVALADPDRAVDRLPLLVESLTHEEPSVRVGAAWALCAIAAERPAHAGRIRAALDGRPGTAADLARTWIDRELLGDSADEPPVADEPTAQRGDATGPDASPSSGGSVDPEAPAPPDGPADRPDEEAAEPADETDVDDLGSDDGPSPGGPSATDAVVEGDRFTIPLARTAFDALQVVDRVATDRHSWTYVGIAEIDARRRAVLVRTYRPPRGARLSTFASAFEDVLSAWGGIDDHPGVLDVHDWGRRPHPWAVLEYASDTLRGAGRLPPTTAFRIGLDAATALAHAHDRGVTHRCLDPRALAVDARSDRPVGRLLNFGIVDAFRAVEGPLPMDSRYAAPELFDDDYGGVDWLTDVYHLGAVLYTAFTGRPPYERSLIERGGPAELSYDPPTSVVEGLPDAADRIVAKAMATHKIGRYESADELARDLQSVLDDAGAGV